MLSRLTSLLTLRHFSRSLRSDREIFVYSDGQQERSIDPLLAWRQLWNDPEVDLAAEAKVARDPKIERPGKEPVSMYPAAEVLAAEDRVIGLTRKVFGVKPLAEGGLTMRETDALLGRFLRYADALKKKRNPSRTPTPLSAPMVSPSSELREPTQENAPPAPLESPMKSDSDCGCTESESSDDAPTR